MSAGLSCTVIMPTIPERVEMRQQAIDSILLQTEPVEYIIGEDATHRGPIPTVNDLAGCVETDWLFRLDDDDLLDADHFEVLSHWLTDAPDGTPVDIVYSWCRVEGDTHPENFFQRNFHPSHLETANWIPCSAMVRTELWHDLGGLREPDWTQHEDWDFWVRAYNAGARFRCVPSVTWTYRLNTEWEHRSTTDEYSEHGSN